MLRHLSVLIVDEDPAERLLIRETLGEGHFTLEVGDANAARRYLRQSRFDVLIVDDHLPDMTGVQLVREISQKHPFIAIVFMNSRRSITLDNVVHKAGARFVLSKPLVLDELRGIFVHLTGESS